VNKFPNVVGVRLSNQEVKKLDRLAKMTFRGRGDVLRLLIAQADVVATPDLSLNPIAHVPAEVEA
jgi:hypothetical protein